MYQLVNEPKTNTLLGVRIKTSTGEIFVPAVADNTDYQAYLRWLEAGNTPEPAEENQ